MLARPHRALVLLVAVPMGLGACQLFSGIGDDLTFDAGDAGGETQDGTTAIGPDAHAASVDAAGDARGLTVDAGADAREPSLDAAGDADAAYDGDGATSRDGAAEEAGRDAALDADAAPGTLSCPEGGTTMVRIDAPVASFCIDVTEVTNTQFASYLALHTSLGSQVPPACKSAEAANAPPHAPDSQKPTLPVTEVPFCFAWDYCASLGKRLCGNLGGGPVTTDEASEWHYACANGGADTTYPYGNVYDVGACVTESPEPDDVATHAACRGMSAPFGQIFDMAGNVQEYVMNATDYDDAGFDNGLGPYVFPMGGAYFEKSTATCLLRSQGLGMFNAATTSPAEVGFRCCADLR